MLEIYMQTRHILLTGTSTGIGRETALLLAEKGYIVHATVRHQWDADSLIKVSKSKILPVIADIVIEPERRTLLSEIALRTGDQGLYAIVNNAGTNLNGPFEHHEENDARALMELNFFAPIALMKQSLPLLRKHQAVTGDKARIINIGSIGSRIGFPWEAFYHASKFALVGLSESVRQELRTHEISVCVVLPGGIKTPFLPKTIKSIDRAITQLPKNTASDKYRHSLSTMKQTAMLAERWGSSPKAVSRAIFSLLDKRNPRFQTYVGSDAQLFRVLHSILPAGVAHRLWSSAFGA
jgi:NAD(P)-dependent dehydrogenase (short-subunit alcohol dehydrogenase family)